MVPVLVLAPGTALLVLVLLVLVLLALLLPAVLLLVLVLLPGSAPVGVASGSPGPRSCRKHIKELE